MALNECLNKWPRLCGGFFRIFAGLPVSILFVFRWGLLVNRRLRVADRRRRRTADGWSIDRPVRGLVFGCPTLACLPSLEIVLLAFLWVGKNLVSFVQ